VENTPWQAARDVLCIRLDTLGDVLMTTPALRAVRQARGDRRITLLTSSAGATAARYVPEIAETWAYDAPWMKATAHRDDSAADRALIERLAAAHFDAAIIFTVFSQNPLPAALTCYLAEIPLRLAHCRENPYHLLTNWARDSEWTMPNRHEVQRQLDLVGQVGYTTNNTRLSFRVPWRDQVVVGRLLSENDIDAKAPWLVVHPGATAPSRRYPPELFAAVADELHTEGYQIVLTGVSGEEDLIDEVRSSMTSPSCSLAGKLTLGQLGAVLARAPLLIANNTGPVHVAAAVGTPVVDLYALTNPQHTPWGVSHRVLFRDVPCKYCYKSDCPEGHHQCLRGVRPESVVRAARALLSRGREAAPASFFVDQLN
jgi:lipopolysaccharide heptosyltransferase II